MTLFLKADQQIVMDKPDFSLTVDVFRNLSPSNSVFFPDLCTAPSSRCFLLFHHRILQAAQGLFGLQFGRTFYHPQPETIPVELLEVPEEIGVELDEKHLVFTLRIILKKVQVGWCWLVAEVYRKVRTKKRTICSESLFNRAAVLSKKRERLTANQQVISLILAKTRVILLMDWIETLKTFVLLNADIDLLPEGHHNVSASCSN
ncbi:hypothetical protein GPALN_006606 [Globodera pallida]|nr:hypothetical protein GPALN_006606 [Globodera pallida]